MNSKLLTPLTVLALLCSSQAFAADHLDGPAVSNDPAADINDLYAFVNPNDPDELIFAATVMPLADRRSRFSDAVEYRFNLQNAASGSAPAIIACRFPGKAVICRGPQESEVAGPQGRVNREGGLRVFAGLRDDPFFFDLVAFQQTVATLAPQFTDPGEDFFEGLNTLAIVIGVDATLIGADGADSILRVYASTQRAESPGQGRPSVQVDRMGRPGINTALIDLLASTGKKDQYNQAADIATWSSLFAGEIAANLAALDTLDGMVGNNLLPPLVLASVLVDDRLLVDAAQPVCDAYLAVELGVPQCGGRTLERDVIDDTFGAVVGPGVSDFVGNTSAFLDDFPFLGEPN
jgi:hypothetical protein